MQGNSDHLNNARIRIITNSDIRYEGTLYKINPEEKTITLRNVQSFGTEDRRTDKVQMASALVYEYIVFRSIEIKDLIVLKEETPAPEKAPEPPKKEVREEPKAPAKTAPTQPQPSNKTIESQPKESGRGFEEGRQGRRHDDRNRQQHTPANNFEFDKMVENLGQFDQHKHLSSQKYETKYENDDFFDGISSSVATDRKREIESYNDKQIDRDTFGHVPRVHFTSDYHRHRHRGQGGQGGQGGPSGQGGPGGPGGFGNRGPRRDDRRDDRRDERRDNRPQGNFRGQGGDTGPGGESRRGTRRGNDEFEYIKKRD